MRVVLVRATDVPTYVQYGGADLGVTGLDTLIEHGGQGLYQPLDLHIAKCRVSVAVRADFDYASAVRQGSRLRVATKYVAIAREFFAAKGVHVDLIKLYGSMELAPLTGLADAIVDLVSTGNTLKANQLVEVERIMDISSRLVVNQAALKLKQAPIRRIIDAFARAVRRTPDAMTLQARTRFACPPPTPASRPRSRRGCIGRPTPTPQVEQRGGRHPGRRAAARRRGGAGVHRAASTACEAASMAALELDAGRIARPRSSACPPRSATRCRPPPRACAATTRRRRRPAARAGATATPTARCWARRSRRWTASASTCRAARRPIRRAC